MDDMDGIGMDWDALLRIPTVTTRITISLVGDPELNLHLPPLHPGWGLDPFFWGLVLYDPNM